MNKKLIILLNIYKTSCKNHKTYNVISGVLTYLVASGMKNCCLQLDS